MEVLLGEHGQVLLYGIIGTMIVLLICSLCADKWKSVTPEYKTVVSRNSKEFISDMKAKFPIIDADEVIFADYKDESFNYKDFIRAKNCEGKDITEDIKVYGNVDVFQKGVYKLRCVVVADNSLICTKYVNVIVE
ncbi:MAG: hypothetical protein ACLRZ9_02885 [Eubacterium sp.]